MANNIPELLQTHRRGEAIAALTAYDASFALAAAEAGADWLLVGDSLGMVVQGHAHTLGVSLEDMVYHTRAVVRAKTELLLVADLPFACLASQEDTYRASARLLAAGAQAVKIEGGKAIAPTTAFLVSRGIPVCAHLGLTPQWVHVFGGFRVQGKTTSEQESIREAALAHADAGAFMVVLESIPAALALEITHMMVIPTIGIGAGPHTSGQILVNYDVLGLGPRQPKFSKNFLAETNSISDAFRRYVAAVKNRTFPGEGP